jgi:hypothetical protein
MPPIARRLVITLVVLVVLFVAADRIGDYVAVRAAATTLKNSQHLDSTPSVDIAGFPFLTQLASGDFDTITVGADDVPVDGGRVAISRLHVVLHGVHVPRNFDRVQADRADATARIGYAELSRLLGGTVSYVLDGRVRARVSVSALGRTVSGSITARPQLRGASLGFGDTRIDGAAGNLAAALTRALNRVFDLRLPLTDIPFKVQVRSLQATAAGIELTLTGSDLEYQRG